jgi:hypothetical protein
MASFSYGGTTSANYCYEYKSPDQASIVETRPPAMEWSDVICVLYKGVKYSLKQIVMVDHPQLGKRAAEIFKFNKSSVIVGNSKSFEVSYEYIRPLNLTEASNVKLDPNAAFRMHKKKRRVW